MFFLLMVLLAGYLALTGNPWVWLAAVLFAGLLVLWVVTLRRLRRRFPALEQPSQ